MLGSRSPFGITLDLAVQVNGRRPLLLGTLSEEASSSAQAGRRVNPHHEVEVLHTNFPRPATAAGAVRAALGLSPGEGLQVDLVLVLGVLALAFDPVDLQEVIDCRHTSFSRQPTCLSQSVRTRSRCVSLPSPVVEHPPFRPGSAAPTSAWTAAARPPAVARPTAHRAGNAAARTQ